jgi:hypothetical protein
MEKQLYLNQAQWFYSSIKSKIEQLNTDKEKGYLTENDYSNAKSRYIGIINAMDIDNQKDVHEQIIYNINVYKKGLLELKINAIDINDPNLGLFYMLNGALTYSIILLTISDNPQSCCPLNKEIILGDKNKK